MGRDRNDGGGVKAFLIFLVPSPCITDLFNNLVTLKSSPQESTRKQHLAIQLQELRAPREGARLRK